LNPCIAYYKQNFHEIVNNDNEDDELDEENVFYFKMALENEDNSESESLYSPFFDNHHFIPTPSVVLDPYSPELIKMRGRNLYSLMNDVPYNQYNPPEKFVFFLKDKSLFFKRKEVILLFVFKCTRCSLPNMSF
jgi:hypothetical protein